VLDISNNQIRGDFSDIDMTAVAVGNPDGGGSIFEHFDISNNQFYGIQKEREGESEGE
jgi:hypothetical protein